MLVTRIKNFASPLLAKATPMQACLAFIAVTAIAGAGNGNPDAVDLIIDVRGDEETGAQMVLTRFAAATQLRIHVSTSLL